MSAKASLLVLLTGLAALWSFSGSPKRTAAEPPVTLSTGHAHDNLTVFILRGSDVLDSKRILTLQEALEKGLAVVHETSNVNMLQVENLSADHELFLQSGDIVKGGKQDRLISQDLLIQANSGKVPCPANCCEHSRWQGRGKEASGKFETSNDFAVGNEIRIANVAQQQGAVWANVAKCQEDLSRNLGKSVTANPSPTSLQLALEDKDLRAKLAAYERDLGGLANAYHDAVGVVIAVNGQVIASDVYGSRLLFQKAWPKLLKSAAADAVAQMPKDGKAAVATREEAEKFLVAKVDGETSRSYGGVSSANIAFEPVDRPTRAGQFMVGGAINAPPAQASSQQPIQFSGRSVATRTLSNAAAGSNQGGTADVIGEVQQLADNVNPTRLDPALVNRLFETQNEAGMRNEHRSGGLVSASPQPSVVSFESRAGAQGNALIHRGQLKK
ncbi:ARPP-1 family domain-containing protein [Limnoglobus roseus]|uniref:ARG and Rhodanese-Phosphatase-superfamily-associated domain-containing protein n=1 Tax=Limnoglobus roseus TaxID=2598579 RepID=A0A5C1AD13_9BACT|nr:DUF6569 family protein [Limnoglobus roseus]QEL15662.1 hypothetical protein PX52LOC_02597 [Limnoglobus roseus]